MGEVVGKIDHPVFGPWSAVYAEGLLEEGVNLWRELLDEAGGCCISARSRRQLQKRSLTSSRYEFMFWEMAYRKNAGPCSSSDGRFIDTGEAWIHTMKLRNARFESQ